MLCPQQLFLSTILVMLVRPCAYACMPTCNCVAMCACFPVLVFALAAIDQALDEALAAWVPGQDPEDRNEKVVHRQFQATVYSPGEVLWEDLPDGPLRESD